MTTGAVRRRASCLRSRSRACGTAACTRWRTQTTRLPSTTCAACSASLTATTRTRCRRQRSRPAWWPSGLTRCATPPYWRACCPRWTTTRPAPSRRRSSWRTLAPSRAPRCRPSCAPLPARGWACVPPCTAQTLRQQRVRRRRQRVRRRLVQRRRGPGALRPQRRCRRRLHHRPPAACRSLRFRMSVTPPCAPARTCGR